MHDENDTLTKARLTKLHRQRGNVKATITSFEKILDTWRDNEENRDIDYLQVSLENVQRVFERFDVIQEELEELDEENELPHRFTVQESFNLAVSRARKYLRENQSQLQGNTALSVTSQSDRSIDNQSIPVKLPHITLPKFNGSIEGWAPFYDLFSSLIDQNPDLTPVAKLQYLRLSVTDKAASLIQSLETIESNYNIAINLLKSKFDCPRRAMRKHWAILREYPKLIKDTPALLGQLADTFNQHLRALENLGAPIEHWSVPIIDLVLTKIGYHTACQWELTLKDNQMPKHDSLLEFLERRASSAELIINSETSTNLKRGNFSQNKFNSAKSHSSVEKIFATKHFSSTKNQNKCILCTQIHPLYYCDQFKALSTEAKRATVAEHDLCFNCLRHGHARENCNSANVCRNCREKHHTSLCLSGNNKGTKKANSSQTEHSAFVTSSQTSELITTALIDILDKFGKPVHCRALIDTCSTTHLITETLASRLGLKPINNPSSVGGVNEVATVSKGLVQATIKSRCSGYQKTLTFRTVQSISSLIPGQPVYRRKLKIPKNIKLADPEFHRPSPVDVLVSSGTALSLLCRGQINLSEPNGPELFMQKTLLGWVIGGSAPAAPSRQNPTNVSCYLTTNVKFDLQNFWSIEEGPSKKFLTEEENLCENHFRENISRTKDGRYVVALPFNENVSKLGESKPQALKRFRKLSCKLSLDPEMREKYYSVMQGYTDLGHMSKINRDRERDHGYYLPHHAVKKESSTTTAVRVVFDGSAPTSTGVSLNDALMTGPTIQADLFTQLLKFRKHAIVLSGDIEKMYRQILVRKDDRKYLRILWYDEKGDEATFELNTVPFGIAPGSFLSVRCLYQLAEDEGIKFPSAARVLREDMYVDNCLTGTSSISEAICLRNELISLLAKGKMNLRQWASNEPQVLEGLPPENIDQHLVIGDTSTIKTLGIGWNSGNDCITYFVSLNNHFTITKRSILSQIARIFDPLGLLAPVIVLAKRMIQDIWKLKLDWDESLPSNLHDSWLKYYRQLTFLNNFNFPRKILIDAPVKIDLHGFSDSSEKAYGACVYIRSENVIGQVQVSLLCAKSRVAPVKQISIPKLELSGALLLTNLICSVMENMGIKFNKIFLWTDSTVVLGWLQKSPAVLKVFVANRVSEIQSKTSLDSWRHVRSADNPADLVSRGQLPQDFLRSSIWQHGPEWLRQPESSWPFLNPTLKDDSELPELKNIQCFKLNELDTSLLTRYSSIEKLQRVVAYCMRLKTPFQNSKLLSISELINSLKVILRLVQKITFPEELRLLKEGKPLNKNSRLLTLTPFLDKDNLIRVGGRLKNSPLSFQQRHPIILPKSHHVTQLLIEADHRTHAHAGTQATLYAFRRRFWVLNGRQEVRKIIRNCIVCFKQRPSSADYLMGNLPASRVTPARPFSRVGIDYCGFFFLKEKKHRNRGQIKAYVAVFVCLTTRAVHLELVTDLTTASFLGAVKRFIARRGICTEIWADNATYFVGAKNQLAELDTILNDEQQRAKIFNFATSKNIQWHFIPARSPTFGGLWEAAVKSFKHHLYRVVGKCLFTYEEFYTFCVEIEAILNSRPLTFLSSDPHDPLVLTPGHFLIGDSLTSLPEQDLRELSTNRLSNWQHIQQVKQHFWSRWSREYLNELTVRHKWTNGSSNITEGTVVLLKETNQPPLHWVIGRVVKTHPGTDGITRVVTVKTAHATLDRSVRNVAPLPLNK